MKMKFFFLFNSLLISSFSGWTQISGRVQDSSNGEPLIGVSIQSDGDEITITDGNGNFTLAQPTKTIIASHVGYDPNEVSISEGSIELTISLSAGAFNLNEVIVTAYHDNRKLIDVPGPISIITKKDLARDQDIIFTNALNRVPGVFMHSGTLNTNRITIRGIGSRSLFSTNRVKSYFNEIPLTTGEGETTMEDIDLSLIERIEVMRGPSSSEYGAGLGGSINLKTKQTLNKTPQATNDFQTGSYGLLRNVFSINGGLENASLFIQSSITESDGFRENNKYKRESTTIGSQVATGEKTNLSFLFHFIDLKAFIPSSVTQASFDSNPRSAASNWLAAKGFEDYDKSLIGASFSHKNDKGEALISVFTSFRNSNEVRPFNILRENTNSWGFRYRYNIDLGQSVAIPLFAFGGEYFHDNYKFSTYENDNSLPGLIESDNIEVREYLNFFIQADWQLSSKWAAVAGINMNKTNYNYDDLFRSNGDQSGDYDFDLIASPRVALNYKLNERNAIHATVSHGFAPPTLAETLTPDGAINPNIKPESGYNFEIGSRGYNKNGRLTYDVTLYTMKIKNLLVPRRVAEDTYVGVNAGKTTHTGLEAAIGYQLVKNDDGFIRNIDSYLNYSLAEYKFNEFIDDDANEDYSGNQLTGTPKNTLNAVIEFTTSVGIYGNLNYRLVDEMPMRDDNSIYSDYYYFSNLKIGWQKRFNKIELGIYIGINNLSNEHYASMILVNAGSFGGAPPRYFYPAPSRNYFSGIKISWIP